VGHLFEGPLVEGLVLGASEAAIWLTVGSEVLVVCTPDAVRLPNGVVLGQGRGERPFARLRAGDRSVVGRGIAVVPGLRLGVVRWWDPRPALPATTKHAVMSRVSQARSAVDDRDDCGLGAALVAGDGDGIIRSALPLLGLGRGLTPEGDDLVAAALAAHRLVGAAVGAAKTTRVVDAVTHRLLALAADRTTSLSASLLRHACAGNVADPVGRLLYGLTGRRALRPAIAGLLEVGHSSGPALAAGVLIGATAACEEAPS
jgi:hypothetical protein